MTRPRRTPTLFAAAIACALTAALAGCGSEKAADRGFSTSGNREADQRADQRMARDQQLKGGDPGAEGDGQKTENPLTKKDEGPKTLYERLGGEQGIAAIVNDFVDRAIADPRVNWERKGMQQGGFSIHRNRSIEWPANEQNKATLKKHLAQFIALSTGGPKVYEGKEMKQAHEGMRITNTEFDASIGDLKQTLELLKIETQEQKELLQIVESTREQVATER